MMKKKMLWITIVCLFTTLIFSIGVFAADRTDATDNAELADSGYSIKQYLVDYYNQQNDHFDYSNVQISLRDSDVIDEIWSLPNDFSEESLDELLGYEIQKVNEPYIITTEQRYYVTFTSETIMCPLGVTEKGELFLGRFTDYYKPNYCEYMVTDIEGFLSDFHEICQPEKNGHILWADQNQAVNISARTDTGSLGGTYEIRNEKAKPGDQITITVTPDRYCVVGSFQVKDWNGDEIAVSKTDTNTWQYVLPESGTSRVLILYKPAPFTDVLFEAWYYNDILTAWETGLINGFEDNTFRPDENMTYAQAVKLAACMNQKYTTGSVTLENGSPNWYDSYVTYTKKNNIISRDYEWDASASRAEYAEIFANALPTEALKARNSVDDWAVPDVDMSHPQSAAIYKLYRAGILTGMDSEGNFEPNNNIKRSEVSAILTRMMNENARKDFTLKFPITPDTPINPVAITDTWEEIIASVNNGTYNEKYHIGDTKELDLGTEGIVEMQIAALDTDELADGSGKAAITWISKQVLNTKHCMNTSLITSDSADPLDLSKFVQGTGNVGGWEYSEMRAWLKEEIKPLMPSDVQNAIKPVIKNTFSIDTELKTSTVKSTEDIWIPSVREVIGSPSDFENEGPLYVEVFGNDFDRVKKKSGASDASVWWLRSITHAGSIASISFATINEDGSGKLLTDYPSVDTPAGVVLGFCM